MNQREDAASPSADLELQFDVINTAREKNLLRLGPRIGPGYWWDTPEREAWVELKPLLQEHRWPLLSRFNPGGGAHDGMWQYAIFGAPAWAALASVLKAYINRRTGQKVVVYGQDGVKLLEVTGDLTAEQIEALLRARVAHPELGAVESGPAPPGGPPAP
jgi:hypothetical protein